MGRFASLLSLLAGLFFFVSAGNGQLPSFSMRAMAVQSPQTDRVSQLVCSVSAFFTMIPGDQVLPETTLDGRGLLSCSNDQGFSTELPVLIDFVAELPKSLQNGEEISFSGNSSTFVIPRDITQFEDIYEARAYSWAHQGDEPVLLLRGKNHDLVIELRLTSKTHALRDLKVTGFDLKLDESAPDLL